MKNLNSANDFTVPVSWLLAFSLSVAPLLQHPGIIRISNCPKQAWLYLSAGLIFLMSACILLIKQKSLVFRKPSAEGFFLPALIVLFLAYGLLSSIWAINHYILLEQWQQWFIASLPFGFYCFFGHTTQDLQKIQTGLVIGAALNALLGLFQFWLDIAPDYQRAIPAGGFLNKNFAASFSVMALPSAFVIWHRSSAKMYRLSWLLAALVISLLIFHSFSRGSWLAGLISVALTALWLKRLRITNRDSIHLSGYELILFVALFAAGTCIGQGTVEPRWMEARQRVENALDFEATGEKASDSKSANTLAHRFQFWQNIVHMAKKEFPLGVGEGNFKIAYPKYANSVVVAKFDTKNVGLYYAHNEYLEVVAESGLMGLLLVCGLAISLYGNSLRSCKPMSIDDKLLILSGSCSVLGLAVNTLVSSPLHWPLHKYTFIVCLLFVFFPAKRFNPIGSLPKLPSLIIMAIAGLVLLYTGSIQFRNRVQSESMYKKAMVLMKEKQHLDALKYARFAADLLPYDTKPNMLVSAILLRTEEFWAAESYIEKVEKLIPYDYNSNYNAYNYYIRAGENKKAIEALERVLTVIPHDTNSKQKQAVLYREIDMLESTKLLEDLIQNEEADPINFILLAENAVINNEHDKARAILIEAREKYPNDTVILEAASSFGISIN